MSGSAQFVILLTMQLGSATMLTLCPVYIRMRSLRAVLPKMTRSRTDLLDLKRFTRVPQWLVEYNALRLCVIVVLTYQLVLHVVCCGLLYTMLMLDDEAAAIVRSGSGFPDEEVSLAWFSVFTSVSAYCNCGFALHPLSFTLLSKKPGILLVVELLVLGGNVLLPVFLYLTIAIFEVLLDPSGSTVVAARYLLLNARQIYSNLFGLQETWLLLIVQAALTIIQTILTVGFAKQPLGSSLFQSINTRHAGMASFSMGDTETATLLVYLLMMFLAPSPFVAVLNKSDQKLVQASRLRATLASSITGKQLWDDMYSMPGFDGPASVTNAKANEKFVGRVLTAMLTIGTVSDVNQTTDNDSADQRMLDVEAGAVHAELRDGAEKEAWEHDVDTRLLLLVKYPAARPPLRDELQAALSAIWHQLQSMARGLQASSPVRDCFFLWLMWFLITAMDREEDVPKGAHSLFGVVFELVSAFGNVGLSLGSYKNPSSPCCFSVDLPATCKLCVMLTMVVGRTREFPKKVDSALEVHYATAEEVMADMDEADKDFMGSTQVAAVTRHTDQAASEVRLNFDIKQDSSSTDWTSSSASSAGGNRASTAWRGALTSSLLEAATAHSPPTSPSHRWEE